MKPAVVNGVVAGVPLAQRRSAPPHRGEPGWLHGLVYYGFCAILMFGPLTFGAVQPWSTFVFESAAALLLALWMAEQLLRGEFVVRRSPLYLPALLFGALLVGQVVFHLTAYTNATLLEIYKYVAYGALLFLAVQLLGEDRAARRFMIVLSTFGFLVALFAILQNLSSNGKLYWTIPVQSGGVIFGPYVNHNHYAGLMELLTPLALSLWLCPLLRRPQRALACFASVVMAASLVLSLSRGGITAFLVQLGVLAVLLLHRNRNSRMLFALVAACAITVGFLGWIGSDAVIARLKTLRDPFDAQVGGVRAATLSDGLHMFADRPVAGWGLGVFPTAYPRYRSYYTNLFINEAHDDWLQVLVETGIIGFALTIWFVIAVAWNGWRNSLRGRTANHVLATASFVAVCGILVHSAFDFNLHIPANAALYFVACACATITSVKAAVLPFK